LSLNSDNVRSSGLTLADLQNYRTAEGAAVLRIVNPGRVRAIVNGAWDAPAMASSYRKDPTACPALPSGTPIVNTTNVSTTTSVTGTIAATTPVSQTTAGN